MKATNNKKRSSSPAIGKLSGSAPPPKGFKGGATMQAATSRVDPATQAPINPNKTGGVG